MAEPRKLKLKGASGLPQPPKIRLAVNTHSDIAIFLMVFAIHDFVFIMFPWMLAGELF
jgi:hypothetical protein